MSKSILTTPFEKSLDQPIFILFQPLDLIQPLFLTALRKVHHLTLDPIRLLDPQKALDLRAAVTSSFPLSLDLFTLPFAINLFSLCHSTTSAPPQSSPYLVHRTTRLQKEDSTIDLWFRPYQFRLTERLLDLWTSPAELDLDDSLDLLEPITRPSFTFQDSRLQFRFAEELLDRWH